MKNKVIASLTLLFGFSAWAGTTANLDKSGVILQGYDAVSYFKSDKPVKGDPKIQTKFDGAIYLFANDADKVEFLKDPKKYAPQFGGWCAYAVADSKSKVGVDPKNFLIQDGRLLLFFNDTVFFRKVDTREKWLHTKDKDSKTFLKEADANWPETQNEEP